MNTKQGVKGHTPGPWTVKEHIAGPIVIGPDMKEFICTFPPAFNAMENASLIASAPALLEACKNVYGLLFEGANEKSALRIQLEQAIKQAEGAV